MPKPENIFTFPDPGIRRSRLSHIMHTGLLVAAVTIASLVAVFYALGYKVNPTTGAIQRTGLIWLTSAVDAFPAEIKVDGKVVGSELPYRSGPLFPGTYSVELSRNGYQPWNRTVTVEPNKVVSFRYVTLIRTNPVQLEVRESDRTYLHNYLPDTKDVTFTDNELYVEGKFVTRFSKDIQSVARFPDGGHVAYQIGNEIWLIEVASRTTQLLATLRTADPADYAFRSNGKVLIYDDGGITKALELY